MFNQLAKIVRTINQDLTDALVEQDQDPADGYPTLTMRTNGSDFILMFADSAIFSNEESDDYVLENPDELEAFLRGQISDICSALGNIEL
jgi:hypothetical protein